MIRWKHWISHLSYINIVTQVAGCCTRIFIKIIYFLELFWLNVRVIQFSISNKSSRIVFHGWMKEFDDVDKMLNEQFSLIYEIDSLNLSISSFSTLLGASKKATLTSVLEKEKFLNWTCSIIPIHQSKSARHERYH